MPIRYPVRFLVLVGLSLSLAHAQSIEQTEGPPIAHLQSVLETEDGLLASGALGGLFRKQDAVWAPVPTSTAYGTLFRFGGAIYAYSNALFSRSEDGGRTWQPSLDADIARPDVTPDSMYALGLNGAFDKLYATGDGVTWDMRTLTGTLVDDDGNPTGETFEAPHTLAIDDEGTWWMAGFSGGAFGPFRSENGVLWTVEDTGIENDFPTDLVSAGGEVFAIGLNQLRRWDPSSASWVIDESGPGAGDTVHSIAEVDGEAYVNARGGGVRVTYRFRANGWEPVEMPSPNAIVVDGGGLHPYAADLVAAYVRGDDGLWSEVTEGLVAAYAKPQRFVDDAVLAASPRGLFLSEDGGTMWEPLEAPELVDAVYAFESVWIGTASDEVFRSTNEGDTWQVASSGIDPGPFHAPRLTDVVEVGGVLYASLQSTRSIEHQGGEVVGGVYRSTNDGASWTILASGYPFVSGLRAGARELTVADPFLYVVTTVGIRRLAVGESQWQSVPAPGTSDNIVRSLRAVTGGLMAETNEGLYRSENDGQSWTLMDDGLPDEFVWNFSFFTVDDTLFALYRPFAGTQAFYRYEEGTWSTFSFELPTWVIWNSVAAVGESVYFGTHGHGIWSAPRSSFVPVTNDEESGVAATAPLLQVYPNPVQDRAVLRVVQPTAAPLHVALYDMLGRRVRVLHDGLLDTNGVLSLSVEGLAPGAYVVRARGESVRLTYQISVVR